MHHGDSSLFKSGLLSATTSPDKVPALPTGVTLWARLYTEVAGNWTNYQDVPFIVTANRVAFTYPTASQQNIDTLTPFSWSPATGAEAYQLTIGTKPGVADLVNSGIARVERHQLSRAGAPDRQTLYAKIVSKIAGSWTDYQAISFTAAPNPVAFTHPTQGQTGSVPRPRSPGAPPRRDRVSDVDRHPPRRRKPREIRVAEAGTSSYLVPALPAGQTLYARIYTGVASGWGNYQDITFTAVGTATAAANRAITKPLTMAAAQRPTPAWMRHLRRFEPDRHSSPPRPTG